MKAQSKKVLLYLALNGLLVGSAHADFVQCNGVWTNQPCEGSVGATISQTPPPAASEDPSRGAKRSLLHELTMKNIKAREEFEIRYDLKTLEDFCLRKETTVEECQKRISQADSELDKKILRESRIASERKQRKADEEKAKIAKTQEESNTTQINIIQNRPYYRYPQYNNPYPQPTYPGGGVPIGGTPVGVPQGGSGVVNQHGYYVPGPEANKPIGGGNSGQTGFPKSHEDSGRGYR